MIYLPPRDVNYANGVKAAKWTFWPTERCAHQGDAHVSASNTTVYRVTLKLPTSEWLAGISTESEQYTFTTLDD